MERIDLSIKCLWGQYGINIEFDDSIVSYKSFSNIEGFSPKDDKKETNEFKQLIDLAHIEKWESSNDLDIEDALEYDVKYLKDNYEYHCVIKEGNYPYGFDYFDKALSLIDDDYSKLGR